MSEKENLDAMSWQRVRHIAESLRTDTVPDEQRRELARELLAISGANISLADKLGIDESGEIGTMASGVDILEGGLADDADTEPYQVPQWSREDPMPAIESDFLDEPMHTFDIPAESHPVAEPEPQVEVVAEAVAEPEPQVEAVVAPESEPEPGPQAEVAVAPEPEPEPEPEPQAEVAVAPEPEPEPEPQAEEEQVDSAPREPIKVSFSNFQNVYHSRDGGLVMFVDDEGHLTAVNAAKLA